MDDRRKKLSLKEQPPALSIIIPTFNEAPVINQTLDAVMGIQCRVEVIVVDGGSFDETVEIVRRRGVRVIASERGRGLQMHAGARAARGEAFCFLHADTLPQPESAGESLVLTVPERGALTITMQTGRDTVYTIL